MLDITPIVLTIIAMALYLINLFLLSAILKRTRNELKQTMVYIFIAIIILFIRRILNLLNLTALYDAEILDDTFAILVALCLLMSAITLFRDIHKMTDVEANKVRGGIPPRRRPVENYHERYRHEPPQRLRPEKREPAKAAMELSARDLVKR